MNKEAPFAFDFEGIKIYDKQNYSFDQLSDLIEKINPGIIICSGWMDKDYLKLVKPWFKKIPTVITLDTHWRGDLKQRLATFIAPFFLTNRFSHAWVPGEIQATYAARLGFKKENIKRGFYCCDLNRFNAIYERTFSSKKEAFPKRFIYAGRYYEFKGIGDLWQAFIELQEEHPNEWELWSLGTGSLLPVQHAKIRHFGFVQPRDLEPLLGECGVFILPSRFEPWAVAVQEFASAGFPLLLSNEVGARESFLEEGKNGYCFDKENTAEIKKSLKKIISLKVTDLVSMSEHSHRLAQKINPEQWSATVKEIYASFR